MDKISEALGAAQSLTEVAVKEIQNVHSSELMTTSPKDHDEEFNEDVKIAKDNIKQLIEDTMDVIPDMIDLIRESQSPMMYNSASNFVKTIAELNKTLVEISKKAAEPAEKQQVNTTTNITQNNVTYSNTTDMIRDL